MYLPAAVSHLYLRPKAFGEDPDLFGLEANAAGDPHEPGFAQRPLARGTETPIWLRFTVLETLEGKQSHSNSFWQCY